MNDPEVQQQAGEIIHSLVDHIEIKPDRLDGGSPGGGNDCLPTWNADPINADITLYGALAGAFAIAKETRGIETNVGFSLGVGARNTHNVLLKMLPPNTLNAKPTS